MGPSLTELGGDTFVAPAGTASLVQVLPFGSASLQYNRGVSVAGGFGGTNNTQTVSATLTHSTLLRDLFVVLNPVYSASESVDPRRAGQVDVEAVTLNLGATHQIAQYAAQLRLTASGLALASCRTSMQSLAGLRSKLSRCLSSPTE